VAAVDVGDEVVVEWGVVHTAEPWLVDYDLEMDRIAGYLTAQS
jgi:hypothetical protein